MKKLNFYRIINRKKNMLFYINKKTVRDYTATLAQDDDPRFNKTINNSSAITNYIQLNNTKILGHTMGSAYLYNFSKSNINDMVQKVEFSTKGMYLTSNIHLFQKNFLIVGFVESQPQQTKIAILDYDFNIISRLLLPAAQNALDIKELAYIDQFSENGVFAGILHNRISSRYSIIIANIDINSIKIIKTIENVPKIDAIVCLGTDNIVSIDKESNRIKVWDISREPGREFVKDLVASENHLKQIIAIDNHRFASISRNENTIKIWDLDKVFSGELAFTLEGHTQNVNQIISIDEITLASGSNDGMIKFWNLTTRESFKNIATEFPVIELLNVNKTTNPEEKLEEKAFKTLFNSTLKNIPVFQENNMKENINNLYDVIENFTNFKSIPQLTPEFISKYKAIYNSSTDKENLEKFITSFETFLSESISQYDKQIDTFKDFPEPLSHLQGLRNWYENILLGVSTLKSLNLFEGLSSDVRAMNFTSVELKNLGLSDGGGGGNSLFRRRRFGRRSSSRQCRKKQDCGMKKKSQKKTNKKKKVSRRKK